MNRLAHLAALAATAATLAACSAAGPSNPRRAAAAHPADALVIPASHQWAGLATPEAAAEELFRAYIELDAQRFRRACARPFGDPRTREFYQRFLDGAAAEIRASRVSGMTPDGAPVDLLKVHPARELPSTFRAPAAYDLIAQRTVKLVEVDAWLAGRGVETSRVLVLQDAGGQWGAAPRPELFGFALN